MSLDYNSLKFYTNNLATIEHFLLYWLKMKTMTLIRIKIEWMFFKGQRCSEIVNANVSLS